MVKEGTTDGAWHGHGRDEVTITAVSTVVPALPVHEHRLPLSNLDLLLPPMDVGVVFFYADPGDRNHHPAAVLKVALAKTLVAYYPLAGEVVANAAGEPELLCSSRGVDVAEATADGTALRDLRLGLPDKSIDPLVPKKKAGVMSVQVTKFKCGGAVVGCTFDHRICDAYSFNMFLVAWAAAARGGSAPPAPSFHRSFLAPREPAPLSTASNLVDRLFVPLSRVPALPDTAAVNRIYRVSAADVAALQASAGSGRTKLEAFTAHLWQLYAKAAADTWRQPLSCCMGVVVDGRTRLRGNGNEDAMACVVSSGMGLPVGEVHFGWGRPAFASYHFPWPGGAGYVMPMPSARGDGDWVVYVHAAPEVVEVMEPEPTTVFRALEGSDIFG
ncbi:hypothetical protein BDA96_06G228400 [Sorghum bicolor]|uniref:Uncharacterized protein n=3 Tax=Sorghum bicolor TaxID=4558 RepID=A0A921QUN1_SORBI|nr:hypothetical protein BDA96_06G228400 [Sorghum bicolor]KXG27076.1 hypothetical protein SORBI_3006G209200 [Sorghum bicolor]